MVTRGHLFVVQADITRLAADAFLVPCDAELSVAGNWRPFLKPGATAQAADHWFTPEGVSEENEFRYLPDTSPLPTQGPDDVVGLRVLVDTVTAETIPDMVRDSLAAVRFAAGKAERRGGRALPLIAMPILGVGQGRFPGRRAEVIRELITQLQDFVSKNPIDVALVLLRTADFAAAQWARSQIPHRDLSGWPSLDGAQCDLADRLGERAARGELSIFAGAGVSQPVGFPDWRGLLLELGRRTDPDWVLPPHPNYPQIAEDLKLADLNETVAQRFRTRKHALGHALLADLRTPALVTTNYDPCLENAAAAIHVEPGLRVLARQVAVGSHPWLLKLHGDAARPDTIVLTTSQYERLTTELKALRGVVESLMLTSHLLFVGFGFADDDFLAMSHAVRQVRSLADGPDADSPVGTAIELRARPAEARAKYSELEYQPLAPEGVTIPEAARLLEIVLDRLAWRCQISGDVRASFLLHPDYQEDGRSADIELREALHTVGEVAERHPESAGYRAVMDLLRLLGG